MKSGPVVMLSGLSLLVAAACSSGSGTSHPPVIDANSTPNATVSALLTAIVSAPAPVVKITNDANSEKILTDVDGKTLYTRKDDVPSSGISNCYGGCAKTWPPLEFTCEQSCATPQTPGLVGQLGSFLRTDTDKIVRQMLYDGQPLYRYSKDKNPGDTKGDGVDGVWAIARPIE